MKTPTKEIDLSGQKFGRLTAISLAFIKRYTPHWRCRCKCGKQKIISVHSLIKGITKSCGCLVADVARIQWTTHGESRKTREYVAWGEMKRRCNNPNMWAWKHYGGRGIKVCKRWERFENFIKDMGRRPEGCSLDRIDNSKGYSPKNCRWAPHTVQMNNMRRNRIIEFNGKSMTIANWEKETGLPLNSRINGHRWEVTRAFTQPYHARRTAKTPHPIP